MALPPEFRQLAREIEDQIRQAADDLLRELRARYSPGSTEALWELRTYGRDRIAHELATDPGEWRDLYERALDSSRLPIPYTDAEQQYEYDLLKAQALRLALDAHGCPPVQQQGETCSRGDLSGPSAWIVERDVRWSEGRNRGVLMETMAWGFGPDQSFDPAEWGPAVDQAVLDAAFLTGGAMEHPLTAPATHRLLKDALGDGLAGLANVARYAAARASLLAYPRRHFAKRCRYCGREFDVLRHQDSPGLCGRCLLTAYRCLSGFGLSPFYLDCSGMPSARVGEGLGLTPSSHMEALGLTPQANGVVCIPAPPCSYEGPQVESALRAYAIALGFVPPATFRDDRVQQRLDQLEGRARDELLAAVIAVRHPGICKELYGSWFEALVAAGVLEGAERRGHYGITCLASDGHLCHSIAEKTIDDWLTSHGLRHTREPRYLRPSGGLSQYRADWQVGEVYVEYLGLYGNTDYESRAKAKMDLARRAGMRVIWLHPRDLLNLDEALGPLMTQCRHGSPPFGESGEG